MTPQLNHLKPMLTLTDADETIGMERGRPRPRKLYVAEGTSTPARATAARSGDPGGCAPLLASLANRTDAR